MPIYDFKCLNKKCENKFDEMFSSYNAYEEQKSEMKCPKCSSKKVQKLISSGTSFVLKGTGWHNTDYPKKGRR